VTANITDTVYEIPAHTTPHRGMGCTGSFNPSLCIAFRRKAVIAEAALSSESLKLRASNSASDHGDSVPTDTIRNYDETASCASTAVSAAARIELINSIQDRLPYSIMKDGIGILTKSPSARLAFAQYLRYEYKNNTQPLKDMLGRARDITDYNAIVLNADEILQQYQTANDSSTDIDASSHSVHPPADSLHLTLTPSKVRYRRLSVMNSVYHSQC
jgi:hypothetical protein